MPMHPKVPLCKDKQRLRLLTGGWANSQDEPNTFSGVEPKLLTWLHQEYIDHCIEKADVNKDGRIDIDELLGHGGPCWATLGAPGS